MAPNIWEIVGHIGVWLYQVVNGDAPLCATSFEAAASPFNVNVDGWTPSLLQIPLSRLIKVSVDMAAYFRLCAFGTSLSPFALWPPSWPVS